MKKLLKEIHMKPGMLFRFHSVAALGFGLAFVALPAFMSELLAVPTDSMGTIGWRYFGIGILTFAGIAYGSRNKTPDEVRFSIILVFFLMFIAMVLLKFALMLFTGLEPNLWMWVVIGFHVLMALAYGNYLFRGR